MKFSKGKSIFEQQPDAVLSQDNPVSTTLYPVLAATSNVRIISIAAAVTWGVTQPTLLEMIVTMDGITIIHLQTNPISATPYYAVKELNAPETLQTVTVASETALRDNSPFMYEGRNIGVAIRVTWAATQPSPLVCRVKWARLI